MNDKRHFPRIDAEIEVAFTTPEAYVTEYTKNISRGGIFVRTNALPDPNAVVELKLKLPSTDEPITMRARVARTIAISDPQQAGSHRFGVGFHFIDWDVEAKQQFDRYYQALEKESGHG